MRPLGCLPVSTHSDASPGISQYVPLRSIWLLQLYASEAYRSGAIVDSDIDDPDVELPVLAATMLCDAIEVRLRKQLSVGFTVTSRTLSRVRGKIELLHTSRHQLLQKGQIRCTFNELTPDSQVNRYVLYALYCGIALCARVDADEVGARCRRLARVLQASGVTRTVSAQIPTTRLTPEDAKPVAIASLLLNMQIPSSGASDTGINRDATDERALRTLFERALHGLYHYHLTRQGWRVQGTRLIHWPLATPTNALLPNMYSDMTLMSPHGRTLVIDAKFTSMATTGHHGNTTLKSAHLYQILAYTSALSAQMDMRVDGAMIYANAGSGLEAVPVQRFELNGARFLFCGLDLTGTPREIRRLALAPVLEWENVDATRGPRGEV